MLRDTLFGPRVSMRFFRPSFLRRLTGCLGLVATAAPLSAQNYVQASFTQEAQTVAESGEVGITVKLSRSTPLEVVVPVILDSSSTAKLAVGNENEDADADYAIPDEDDLPDGITWDADSKTFLFTFDPGSPTSLTLPLEIQADRVEEGNETIVLRMDEANVTVARPVRPTIQTITIEDDDPVSVSFSTLDYSVREGTSASIQVVMSAPPPESVTVRYAIEYGTATAADIDTDNLTEVEENDQVVGYSLTISAGTAVSTLSIPTVDDLLVENENEPETLKIRLVSLTFVDSEVTINLDTAPVTLNIYDDDPTTANISVSGYSDEERAEEIEEIGSLSFSIVLSSEPSSEVIIPLNIGGTAVRGEDEDSSGADYWLSGPDDPTQIVFKSTGQDNDGNSTGYARSVTVTLNIISDTIDEADETIELSLGTPSDANIQRGDDKNFKFTILDNDPVRLSFAKSNVAAINDDTGEEPAYLPAGTGVAAEADGGYVVRTLLSGYHTETTTFRIEIVQDGTTATPYDQNGPSDQDWDFYVQLSSGSVLTEFGDSKEMSVTAGNLASGVTIYFNNDDESPVVYGSNGQPESIPADVEGDETIHLRLSEVNTSDSGVTFNGDAEFPVYTDFVLTVKELPDLDVTALFNGRAPLTDNPDRNTITSLHDLQYQFDAPSGLQGDQFAGYRTYKVLFPTANFDPDTFDPDDPQNGPNDVPEQIFTGAGESYYYQIHSPFHPRYPQGQKLIRVIEGEPVKGNNPFERKNADYYVVQDYFLRPLNLPVLDSQTTLDQEDFYELSDDFDFHVEFTNAGRAKFPIDRVSDDHAVRFFLSRDTLQSTSGTAVASSRILRMVEQDDGSILFEVEVPSTINSSGNVIRQNMIVEYMDEDGVWRLAQPTVLRGLGSRLYWIDHGYPRTESHPKDARMRLYRFSSTSN